MPFDFAASARAYIDHLVPIWQALEPHERGRFYTSRSLVGELARHGIEAAGGYMGRIRWEQGLVVVASYPDLKRAGPRPVVLLEHGAGQDYGDAHPSNPGGKERERVVLFLCPNESVADRNRRAYPSTPCAVVGCPRMDRWHSVISDGGLPDHSGSGQPIVAISFHWDNTQAPESRWAFPHYRKELANLASHFHLLGHAHPRAWGHLEAIYRSEGIEPVCDFDEVLARADLYVCDNSSTLFEFASTGRPVVCLNAPWYRRDVSHGLRFWDQVPGLQCDEPGDLVATIDLALSDPPEAREIRRRAVLHAYALRDGRASERAAQALREAQSREEPTHGAQGPRTPAAHPGYPTRAPGQARIVG